MRRWQLNIVGLLVVAIVTILMLEGCALKRARDVEFSGFLGDYSLFERGRGEERSVYIYENPNAAWKHYNKIILDPVQVWRSKGLKGPPQEDMQLAANNFHALLRKEIAKDYTIVTKPGPRTLRMRVALTSMKKGGGAADVITTLVPAGWVVAAGSNFISGKPSFSGELSVEAKVTDSRTGVTLGAGVDRRVGRKSIAKMVDSWDDVNKIFEIMSKLIKFRLCKNRGATNCVNPVE